MLPAAALPYLEFAQRNLTSPRDCVVVLYHEDQWPAFRAAATLVDLPIVGSLLGDPNGQHILMCEVESQPPKDVFKLVIAATKLPPKVTEWRTAAQQVLRL